MATLKWAPPLGSVLSTGFSRLSPLPAPNKISRKITRLILKVSSTQERPADSNQLNARESFVFRRDFFFAAGAAVSSFILSEGHALADPSTQVQLRDVEDQQLQDALRAAVSGDPETAERLFTVLLDSHPLSASLWSNRGSVRLTLDRPNDALVDFSRAIELAPNASVPFLNRAIAYEALGQLDAAVTDCKSAIKVDPKEYAAWFNLGNVLAKQELYSSALSSFNEAAALAPGIAGYRLRYATTAFQLGQVEEAEKVARALVRKYPNYTEAHAALAAFYWSDGKRSEAEGQFNDAVGADISYKYAMWVEDNLQWPPRLVEAYRNLINIKL